MDMQKTIREIGMFETAVNLAKVSGSADVVQKVGASMPLPDEGIGIRVGQIAEWLLDFGKSKYMFLTPEIALIEEMGMPDRHHRLFRRARLSLPVGAGQMPADPPRDLRCRH